MLNKLLDYEFRATRRTFGGIYLALALVSAALGLLSHHMLQSEPLGQLGHIELETNGAAGVSAAVLNRLGLARNMDAVCIGNIMLLISGMAFTTSLRDMISGDTISGLLGLCEAVLQALAIAAGFAVAMWTVGGGI